MSAVKPPQASASSAVCTLQTSLLTLAIFTLVSFTYLSLKSLSSTSLGSPAPPLRELVSPSEVKVAAPSKDKLSSLPVNFAEREDEKEEISDVFHTPEVFRLNYAEMEKNFKVYIYPEGDPNTSYQTPRKLTGKYASEGYFFQNVRESIFVTDDPDQAHLFFIPISCHKMRGKLQKQHLSQLVMKVQKITRRT